MRCSLSADSFSTSFARWSSTNWSFQTSSRSPFSCALPTLLSTCHSSNQRSPDLQTSTSSPLLAHSTRPMLYQIQQMFSFEEVFAFGSECRGEGGPIKGIEQGSCAGRPAPGFQLMSLITLSSSLDLHRLGFPFEHFFFVAGARQLESGRELLASTSNAPLSFRIEPKGS